MKIFTLKTEDGTEQRFTVNDKGELIPLIEQEPEVIKKSVYTPDEGRAILGLARNTFMRLLYDGKIRAVKAGRRWLIPAAAIDEFLNAQ